MVLDCDDIFSNTVFIEGTCKLMCPSEEIRFRTQKGLVHILEEGVGDPESRLVKSYQRSAAGVILKSTSVRPPSVLERTVQYLLDTILNRKDIKFSVIYGFIEDRLRAVRQDLIVQQVKAEYAIMLLEPMARFYALAYHRLSGVGDCPEFDSTLNHKHLLECLKWLLRLYDSVSWSSLERSEMEAMYLILNLGHPQAISRSLNLPPSYRSGLILSAERLSIDWCLGNYYKVCRNLKNLPLLLQALACSAHLPTLRRYAYHVMSSAYNSKNLSYPVSNLKKILLYENDSDVVSDARHFGLTVQGSNVHFVKGKFDEQQKCIMQKPCNFIERKIGQIHLSEMILISYLTESS